MDFTLDDDQAAMVGLARRLLGDKLGPTQLRDIEADPDWFARDVWTELARADLLGLCLPINDGGGGYGIFEACLLLEQIGMTVAPVPLLASLVMGAMPVARYGTSAQRAALLPLSIAGEVVLTAALLEAGAPLPPAAPETAVTRTGQGWVLEGEKVFVPAGHLAHRMLVPARTGPGTSAVFLVDPTAAGVTVERSVTTTYEPLSTVNFAGVVLGTGDVLGEDGPGGEDGEDGMVPATGEEVVAWITERAVAGLCAMQAGVCESALRLTASYTSERRQFNAPIATFQAVAQRLADAYIDTEAIRLTAYQAAWRLAQDEPAADALAVAKFWAAEGGHRVVHAAQHLHGGIGVDVDYPMHRFFRWATQLELVLGGASRHLLDLGATLAREPA